MKVRKFEHPSVGYVLEPNVESGDFVKSWQLENPRKHFQKHFHQKKRQLAWILLLKEHWSAAFEDIWMSQESLQLKLWNLVHYQYN